MPELSYRDALDWVVSTGSRGVKAGLDRTEALLDALGDPHRGLRGVLVAGTNGKGSICAMIESACRAAGLRTVLLTKPHLTSYRERIAVDGEPVSGELFAELVEEVRPAVAAVEQSEIGAPTQFEILTAIGILAARRVRPDVLVCEVGLGGRLDSTNVLDLGVSCVGSIALDHREFLGSSVEEIAAEKAGIIKPGDDVVVGATAEPLRVVERQAAAVGAARLLRLGAEIERAGQSRGLRGVELRAQALSLQVTAEVPLPGDFQIDNAALAVAACAALAERGVALPASDVAKGLGQTRWRARLQWIAGRPPLLIDGAHNPAALTAIAPTVAEIVGGRQLVVLAGCMADKDVPALVAAMRQLGGTPVLTQPGTPRAASAVELARLWGPGARAIGSLPDALSAARMLAGETGVVLVCGSLYLAGDVLALIAED